MTNIELAALPANDSASLEFLAGGSASDFIEALKREIDMHPALNHPFLTRLGEGQFSSVPKVLKDYGHQYSFYSQWFTRYLDGVINQLDSDEHKAVLLENMEEERGIPDSPNLEDRPHVELFELFKSHVGVDEAYAENTPPCTTVLLWRDLFLQKCSSSVRGVGLAAIGLATEHIISTIYPYIIDAIDKHAQLPEEASLFFRLHVHCDDGHAEVLEKITTEVAEDVSNREAIRFGVFSSLNLRAAFWDAQLARAESI